MVRRFGSMIKIKPEGLEQYKAYHANPLPGVNEMIKECNLKNYSIYQRGDYMFSYFEYDGEDYEADMEKMAADPTTQHWWSLVKPLMQPLCFMNQWKRPIPSSLMSGPTIEFLKVRFFLSFTSPNALVRS